MSLTAAGSWAAVDGGPRSWAAVDWGLRRVVTVRRAVAAVLVLSSCSTAATRQQPTHELAVVDTTSTSTTTTTTSTTTSTSTQPAAPASTTVRATRPARASRSSAAPRTPVPSPTTAPALPAPASSSGTARVSWYGRGARTANGERFQPDAPTFAHRTMAFGTLIRFCHDGRCVVARCTDRGPAAWTGRTFDLSRGAFAAVAPLSAGVVTLTWEAA